MRYEVIFSPESEADLVRIYRSIALKGFPENAAKYVEAITEFCLELTSFPKRGTFRNELVPGLRVLGFRQRAIVAFAVSDSKREVTILRILGHGQSLEKAFEADE